MTTPTEDARAALAELDIEIPDAWVEHRSVGPTLVVTKKTAETARAALRALIEPPTDDDREALTRSVGMLLAENDDMEAMDDDAFEIVRDSLVKGLMELYPAGFRRQVSHPEPVTDAEVEAVRTAPGPYTVADHEQYARILEAARAVRLPVPEEGS